jgi:hypothetical protein
VGISSASGHALYPIDNGTPRPLPFLSTSDVPLQWSADGRYLYVRRDNWPPQNGDAIRAGTVVLTFRAVHAPGSTKSVGSK